MLLPSGENATLVTASVCPSSSVRKKPKVASCTRTVLSSAAMAMVLPSGEYATPSTGAAAGGAGSFGSSVASSLRVCASQSLTVPSQQPVAISPGSRQNVAAATRSLWPSSLSVSLQDDRSQSFTSPGL